MASENDGKDDYPCLKFQMDVGASFQACGTCGWIKPDHKPMTRKKIKKAYEKQTNGKVITASVTNRRDAAPCDKFERDLTRVEYEVCACGWTPLEHKEAAQQRRLAQLDAKLKADKEKNSLNFREEAKAKGEPCSDFEVDVNNNQGGYGICLCGSPREAHVNFKIDGKKYEELRGTLTAPKEFE